MQACGGRNSQDCGAAARLRSDTNQAAQPARALAESRSYFTLSMLQVRARTLSNAKLRRLKFERALLIVNPLFADDFASCDFQSSGPRPLHPSVPMLPANRICACTPTLEDLLLLRPANVAWNSKLRQSALQNRLPNAPDETRIGLLRAPQLLHFITSHASIRPAHSMDRNSWRDTALGIHLSRNVCVAKKTCNSKSSSRAAVGSQPAAVRVVVCEC